jgi:hypothetical protein
MFAEDLTVSLNDKSFDLQIINGCAVLKTNKIADNEEGLLTITVNSFEQTLTYNRALVNAGSQDIARHQQFLIIDRDFDGIEDLYDSEVDETSIEIAYQDYKARNPGHGKGGNFFTVEINGNIGGSIETIGFNS